MSGAAAIVSAKGARGVAVGEMTGAHAPPSGDLALLPLPTSGGLGNLADGLTVLYAMQTELSAAAVRDAANDASSKTKESRAKLDAFEAATRRQAHAEKKSRGFWATLKKTCATIGKIASVVAGAAAIVGTGGAAAPLAVGIAGVALSAGGIAVRELKLLGKDSDKVGFWMEVGGAGVALGGTALASFGLIAASANMSAVTAGVRLGATLTQSATSVVVGGTMIAIADFQRDADHAAADREDAQLGMDRIARERKMIVESVQEGVEASKDAIDATRTAIEAVNRYEETSIMGVKG